MVEDEGLHIGRDADNDIVIDSDWTSRHHARVHCDGGRWLVTDLGSRNGTGVNGERVRRSSRVLHDGDAIVIAGETLRFLTDLNATHLGQDSAEGTETGIVRLGTGAVSVGRHPSNRIVLDDPNISRFHAEIASGPSGVEVRDLGSRNGTRVNGQLVVRAVLELGDEIGIGPFRLTFDGTAVKSRDDRGALRLHAAAVSVDVAGKRILQPTSLDVGPNEFVAVIGESGSGKSTLIRAMAGIARLSGGLVTINGDPVLARQTDIGYVPQDEIVHSRLSVLEALKYAARLRLPEDVSTSELAATVERAADELGLSEQLETRIGDLSGGQRKRVGVAVELLSQPGLLLLDEPTTGLDPGLETRTMKLLRELADRSRAVVAVTHATRNLGLCDQLVVMRSGGILCFAGTPDHALAHFKADSFDDIYTKLEEDPPGRWRQSPSAASEDVGDLNGRPRAGLKVATPRKLSARTEWWTLTKRYGQLMQRDRRNLAILLGQVPIIAAGILGLFHGGLFSGGSPRQAAQLLFLLTTTAIWLGSIDAAREIVKERPVYERERAIGMRLSTYLGSKAAILLLLATVQCVLLVGIVLAFQPLHQGAAASLVIVGLTSLTAWAAVAMGLVLSAGVRTQDQATSFIPLALIPQLLFAGAIVPVKEMGAIVEGLSWVIFARWSFAGLGSAAHMDSRLQATPALRQLNTYGTDFFTIRPGAVVFALIAFLALLLLVTAIMLRRPQRA